MGTLIQWAIYIFIGFVALKLIGKLLAKFILIPIIMVVGIFILGCYTGGFWNGVGWAVLLSFILLIVIGIGDDTPESKGSGKRSSGGRRRSVRSTPQDNENDSAATRAKNDKLRNIGYRINDAEREVSNRERDVRDAESDLRNAEYQLDGYKNTSYPDSFTESNIREAERQESHYSSKISSAESRLRDAERKLSDLESEYRHVESYG